MNVIRSLIDWKLNEKTEKLFDDYVYRTFDAYTRNKKSIEISLHDLEEANESMCSLIAHSLRMCQNPKDENDKTNLVKPMLSKLFPNAKNVHINAWRNPFSLFAFLSVIRVTKWQQITIKSYWISALWEKNGLMIEKEYNANGYSIVHWVDLDEHLKICKQKR